MGIDKFDQITRMGTRRSPGNSYSGSKRSLLGEMVAA